MLFGGIEGGGTKFVCAIADESGVILEDARFPTVDPTNTLAQAITFFKQAEVMHTQALSAIGIASFGPIDLNPASPTYGYITKTPKAGWSFTNVVGTIQAAFPNLPVGFDTDVNGAALAEHRWGAAQQWTTFVYFTVGTGIGGGAMVQGGLLHGLIHPEMGHLMLPKHPNDPLARGVCPFHTACLEGLASGPSIKERWSASGETLPADHPAWDIEAYYLAHACADLMVTLSPQGIILGGSVMHQAQLFPLVRRHTQALINNYLTHEALASLDAYIVPPGLGDRAGVQGSIALAIAAYESAPSENAS